MTSPPATAPPTPPETHNQRLTRLCMTALSSLHCELPRREKLVLQQLVNHSYALDLDEAMIGSNDQLALLARVNKWDVSHALTSLRRNRVIQQRPAAPLRHFRRPMLYRVLPDALLRLAADPATQSGEHPCVARARADTAAWLVGANRCYPLQYDLIPPDARELDLALAEISRAAALADDHLQNEEPKSGGGKPAGEVFSSAHGDRTGAASLDPANDPRAGKWVEPGEVGRRVREGSAPPQNAAGEQASVGESPTTRPPSWKSSNYSCARDQMLSDNSDGDKLSPSGYPDKGMQGEPVGNFPTEPPEGEPPGGGTEFPPLDLATRAAWLLADHGVEWTAPTTAERLFEELTAAMGAAALGNYGSWWWARCLDAQTRGDVRETLATWKLAHVHPKHKPWRGGRWRDEFFKRQRVRLEGAEKETQPA